MKIDEISFSVYPVTDMERALSFYQGVLGLKVTMNHETENAHWVEFDIGEGTLAIGKSEGMNPSPDGGSVALEVDDFDKAVAELEAAGVKFIYGPLETPVCHMAFVCDPDGNSIGIHKRKASPSN